MYIRTIIVTLILNVIKSTSGDCLFKLLNDKDGKDVRFYNYNVICIQYCRMFQEYLANNGYLISFYAPDFQNLHMEVIGKDGSRAFDYNVTKQDVNKLQWNQVEIRKRHDEENGIKPSSFDLYVNNHIKATIMSKMGSTIRFDLTSGKLYARQVLISEPSDITANKEPDISTLDLEDDYGDLEPCNSEETEILPEVEDVVLFLQQYWYILVIILCLLVLIVVVIICCWRSSKKSHNRELHRVLSHSDTSHDPDILSTATAEYTKVDVKLNPPGIVIADHLFEGSNDQSTLPRSSWIYSPAKSP